MVCALGLMPCSSKLLRIYDRTGQLGLSNPIADMYRGSVICQASVGTFNHFEWGPAIQMPRPSTRSHNAISCIESLVWEKTGSIFACLTDADNAIHELDVRSPHRSHK